MKKKFTLSFLLALSSLFILNSCTKEDQEVDNETQSAVDNAVCEQQFMAIAPVVNEKGINEAGIKKIAASCGTWTILGAIGNTTITPSSNDTIDSNADGFYDNGPVTFEIDYGTTTGCLAFDSLSTKYGKIRITTAKRWSAYNNPVTIDLLNYKINTVNYSAQIIITRLDSVTVTTQINNGHCTNGTWNIDYTGTKTIKQIAGYSTKNNEADDVISITGSSSGKNREGRNFTTNITSALIKKSTCKWMSSGTVDVTPDGFKTRTVDFGNGSCDDDATFTVNGQTISFKLK
ncbi:MAG: hypothetical protein C0448_06260 [Sphingobacteriaceae bacterium]|nr:hypothetical protein [Sphingobacteriaceae bacterium]